MCDLPTRFCCFSLRHGVYFIALLDILFAIAIIVIACMVPPMVGGPTQRGTLLLLTALLAAINAMPAFFLHAGPYYDEKWFLVPWIIVRSIYLIILLILMVVIPLYFKPALSVWLLTLESFVVQKPNSYAEEMFVAPSRVSFGISPKMVHSPSIAENGTEETFDDVTSSPGSPFDVLLTYSKIIHLVSIIVTEIVLLIVFGWTLLIFKCVVSFFFELLEEEGIYKRPPIGPKSIWKRSKRR